MIRGVDIRDVQPADTGVGTHVTLSCGCVILYLYGAWRSTITMCWNHDAQMRMGLRIVVGHPAHNN